MPDARTISLFVEDYGHREFLVPLVQRLAADYGFDVETRVFSATGGFGKVESELTQYVRDLLKFKEDLPDLIVVAQDANCAGFTERRKRLQEACEPVKERIAFAVPDLHIERWLLRDPRAFKRVLGAACKTPGYKCDRDRYKKLLAQAVQATGVAPTLGGLEHAEAIVGEIDVGPATGHDDLSTFLQELHTRFRQWSRL